MSTMIERVPGDKLQRHPRNPRQGVIGIIKESIATNGWLGVLVAQRSTDHLLVGNHRYGAAMELFEEVGAVPGLTVVKKQLMFPVHYRDVDDEAALRILLADNRAGDLATYDEPMLLELLLQIEAGGELRGLTPEEALSGTLHTVEDVQQLDAGLTVGIVEPWNNDEETNRQRFLETDLRQVTMIMGSAEYGPIIDTLSLIREREGFDTNKDVMLYCLKLDPAGADLEERIAAETAASANGEGPSASATPDPASEPNEPAPAP